MQYLRRHKKILLLLAAALTLGFVSINLFDNQQRHSEKLNSGTTIEPSTLTGRAACEIPIPDISNRHIEADFSTETKDLTN